MKRLMGPEQLAQLQERNKRTRARKLDAETAGAIVGKTRAATKALVGSEDVDEDDNPLIEDYFQESMICCIRTKTTIKEQNHYKAKSKTTAPFLNREIKVLRRFAMDVIER